MTTYRSRYAPTYRPTAGYRVGAYGDGVVSSDSPLKFSFDPQNIDGTNNSSLTDGQTIGTYVNLGAYGAAGNLVQATAGSRPFYRLIAASGKLNNLSAVQSDGARIMSTGACTLFTQPSLVCMIVRSETLPAIEFFCDGRSGGSTARQTLLQQSGTSQMASNSIVNGGVMQAAKFHMICATYSGAASTLRLDGVTSGALNPGVFALDGVTLFASLVNSGPMTGFLGPYRAYTGPGQPTAAAVEAEWTTTYGAFPQ